jgi:hypothetical protein
VGYIYAQKDYKVGEYQEEPEENEWKNVALEFGKKLPVILPYNYDELPPDAWFRWVVFTYDKYMEQRDKESGYTPTPQTPEQVEEGLREAFRTAIKEGIIPEIKQPTDELIDKLVKNPPEFLKFELGKTLTDLIHRWWDDVFTTHSDWDMETSIEDLVDQIQMWLPKEQSAAGSQNAYVECAVEGFNDCLNKIKRKLR